jgi:hypothetical protein
LLRHASQGNDDDIVAAVARELAGDRQLEGLALALKVAAVRAVFDGLVASGDLEVVP